jgi:hypothetical protein
MKKNKLSIYFIFISVFSFLTIFIIIVQKSYLNLVNPIKEVQSNELLTPIDPNLNLEIIDKISNRPENIENYSINFSTNNAIASSSGNKTDIYE